MTSHPGPTRQIEKEWKKTALLVGEQLGIQNLDSQVHITNLLEKIKETDPGIYTTLNDYFNSYQNYVRFIKDVDERNLDHYFQLEDQMNEKKQELYRQINLIR